jgi:hypothetical protein
MMNKAQPTIPSQVHVPAKVGDKTVGDKEETKGAKHKSSWKKSSALKGLSHGPSSLARILVFLRVLLALPGPVFLAFSIQQYVDGIGTFGSVAKLHVGFVFAVAVWFTTAPLWLFSLLLAQIDDTVDINKPQWSLHGRRVWTPLRAFECALFWLTAYAYVLLYSQDRVYFGVACLLLQPFFLLGLYTITNIVRAIINHQVSGYHSFLLSQGWRVFVNAIFCVCVMLYGLSAMSRIPIDALSIVAFDELSFSGIACSDQSAFLNAFGASGANASCPAKPHCGYRTYEDLCQAVQYSTMARGLSIDLQLILLFVFVFYFFSLILLGTGRLRANKASGYSHLFSRHMIVAMLLGLVQLMNMIFSCMRLLLIVPRLQSPRQAAYFDREDSMVEELPLFCYSSDCIGIHLWGTVCLHALIAVVVNFDILVQYALYLGSSDKELKKAIDRLRKHEWEDNAPFFYFLSAEDVRECFKTAEDGKLPRMQTLKKAGKLTKMKIPLIDAFRGEGIIKNILFVSHRWEEPEQPDVYGEQLKAIDEYLDKHRDIEWVWFDYSSMPQKVDGVDTRTPEEKAEFQLMLAAMADLYLTARVLILLDGTYASRFWTLTEAWCSMQTVTSHGLRPATEAERRHTIECIHNADEYVIKVLINKVSTQTPDGMYRILKKPDVQITNAKDKDKVLPEIKKIEEHVKETFQKQEMFQKQREQRPASVQTF